MGYAISLTQSKTITSYLNERSTLLAFGDSFTVGVGASSDANEYANRIATAKNLTLTNNAVSGSQAQHQAGVIFGTAITDRTQSTLMIGFNDYRWFGDSEDGRFTYESALSASLVWLAIPDDQKVLGTDTTKVTYGGTWTNTDLYGSGKDHGKVSTTQNNTATFTLYGDTLYICTYLRNTGSGVFTITIDGVVHETVNCTGSVAARVDVVNSLAAINYAPRLIRISELTDTLHTVVITHTSAASNVYFEWAASASKRGTSYSPYVYVGNLCRMESAGYAAAGPDHNKGSDAIVEQYNTIVKDWCDDLAADGLNVLYVDVSAKYNTPTDIDADLIHPNNTGHSHISEAFIEAMNSVSYPRSKAEGGDGDVKKWTRLEEPAKYASSTTFSVIGDLTGVLTVGTPIKLKNTTTKFFNVKAISFSTPKTTITVDAGSDYTLAEAAITDVRYAPRGTKPSDFPSEFNYTVSYSGFSANPTTRYGVYSMDGNLVRVRYATNAAGTTNSTSPKIGLPFQPTSYIRYIGYGENATGGAYLYKCNADEAFVTFRTSSDGAAGNPAGLSGFFDLTFTI